MHAHSDLAKIRGKRAISAAQLATLAGVSRQTIYAIEAGDYVPNTTLALRLAQILEVRVEDLFQLESEAAVPVKPIVADVLRGAATVMEGQPVQLCQVGKRLIAVPAMPQQMMLPAADGIVVGDAKPAKSGGAGLCVYPIDGTQGLRDSGRLLVAGCDPGVSLLTQHLARAEGVELVVAAASSQQALEWLKEGLVHIAGTHLHDADTGEYNLPAVARLFPAGSVKVVTFAIWEQGLVFAGGNPKGVRSVADLARKDLTIINREKGAGSRELLDRELQRAGIHTSEVKGYDRTAYGHLPAALAVSQGEADCCVATRSAAQAFGLGFLPLASERYDLVIRRPYAKLASVEALLEGLNRSAIRRRLELLAGYDTSRTGEVRVR